MDYSDLENKIIEMEQAVMKVEDKLVSDVTETGPDSTKFYGYQMLYIILPILVSILIWYQKPAFIMTGKEVDTQKFIKTVLSVILASWASLAAYNYLTT